MKLGMLPGVATHGDTCVGIAIGAGMAESVPSDTRGSSVSLVEVGVPRPLMVALSLTYCVGRQGLRSWGKPATAPRPHRLAS